MAIQRSNASEIVTEIRRLVGQVDSNLSDDLPNTRILSIINRYLQSLTNKVSSFLRGEGSGIKDGTLKLRFYRKTYVSTTTAAAATFVVTAGGSTIDFPDDIDYIESVYDTTHERELEVAREVNKRHTMGRRLRSRPAGPPEAYEPLGYATSGSLWVSQATLRPSTPSGSTPTLTLTGYRKPAALTSQDTPATDEYPDLDPRYEELAILGPVISILTPDDPTVSLFADQEQKMIGQLASTAVLLDR
jgi:hypothetical protein